MESPFSTRHASNSQLYSLGLGKGTFDGVNQALNLADSRAWENPQLSEKEEIQSYQSFIS